MSVKSQNFFPRWNVEKYGYFRIFQLVFCTFRRHFEFFVSLIFGLVVSDILGDIRRFDLFFFWYFIELKFAASETNWYLQRTGHKKYAQVVLFRSWTLLNFDIFLHSYTHPFLFQILVGIYKNATSDPPYDYLCSKIFKLWP